MGFAAAVPKIQYYDQFFGYKAMSAVEIFFPSLMIKIWEWSEKIWEGRTAAGTRVHDFGHGKAWGPTPNFHVYSHELKFNVL